MALASRKRSRSSQVKQETVGHAISFLQDLPEKAKEELSLKEAVRQMHEPIKAALAKGYSYEDVAKMLSDQGIKISALTLKNYAPSGKRQAAKAKTRRPRQASSKSSQSNETNGAAIQAETKPRRGRTRSAAKAKSEPETKVKPTRTRRAASTKTAAKASTPRKSRQSKTAG